MPRSLLRNIKWHYDTNSRETSDKSWQQDYFSNSDKISGRTFDGNNELFFFFFCVCVSFFSFIFYTLFTPTSSCDDFQKKTHKFGILHLGIFWQRKVPVGLPFPGTGLWVHSPAPAQEEMLQGLSRAGAAQGGATGGHSSGHCSVTITQLWVTSV